MTTQPTEQPLPAVPPFHLRFLWAANLGWTLILLFMNLKEFLGGGQWTYQGPGSLIYFATLAAYAGVKETHNWTAGELAESKGRRGVFFVGVWVVFAMLAFLAINLGQGYVFPHELLTINLEVLGIFFGTQASRALRKGRARTGKYSALEEGILRVAKETGGAGTGLLAEKLGVERWDVQYAAGKLVKEGRLKKVGRSPRDPNTKYVTV